MIADLTNELNLRRPTADASSVAAAADRLVDDPFEIVSPELVLVDAALSAQVRSRLPVPEDTLRRLEPGRGGWRPATSHDRGAATRKSSGDEALVESPGQHVAQRRRPSRMYPTLPSPVPGLGYREDASDAVLRRIRERRIEDHFDDEPPKKTSRRSALRVVSVAAAWCSLVIFAVDLRLGLAELPGWLH
jgi:hypothetical protein